MMTEMPENNCKNEQKSVFGRQPLSRQRSLPATRNNKDHHHKSLSREELKLASLAISHNASLRSADMPISMMERAFRYARSFLDASAASSTSSVSDHRPSPTLLARSIKKVKILLQLIWKFFYYYFFFPLFCSQKFEPDGPNIPYLMLLNDSGIRLVVRAGMALCGGQEFWLVRISFTRRVRVFFCGLLLVSSLQDRGALGQRLIDHHGVGLQSRKTILLKKNRFLCPVLVASSFSSLLCSFFRFEISAQSMYRTSLH